MSALAEQADRIADLVQGTEGRLALFVTGAGVSAASGIATFRGSDPGAVWRHHDVEIATCRTLHSEPLRFWTWYGRRFLSLRERQPNAAHQALAAIDKLLGARGRDFLLVTQNIDTLHERAGAERLVKVHGTSDRIRCSRYGCRHGAPSGSLPLGDAELEALVATLEASALPKCPGCGATLRPHVLLFDEYYTEHEDYGFQRVEEAAGRAAFIAFVGTSLSVGVTAFLEDVARRRGIPALLIDPVSAPTGAGTFLDHVVARAEELLPAVLERLGR